uniref:Ribosome-binding factor A n=1 Tax=Candidatus Kentrum sp. TUN TaxID=2126343 RepID=A0A450ZMV7_9GAMM|nr:MAG: ribosome-binding factor A [Candidatus Kentron sp. TUN]VFK56861.1 MAG: ribosome-binding factor A [Candidatus Kentron sp. TUN]VFK60926.1 MAG: ribosome-binding factor A [Candidatus Kentron sp. TUN]
MPREFNRAERMAYQIQRELAVLIVRNVSDPRLHNLTISEVDVSRDLAAATVYFAGEGIVNTEETLAVLQRASGFFRKKLANRIRARSVPRLKFVYDHSFDQASRLLTLIDDAVIRDS